MAAKSQVTAYGEEGAGVLGGPGAAEPAVPVPADPSLLDPGRAVAGAASFNELSSADLDVAQASLAALPALGGSLVPPPPSVPDDGHGHEAEEAPKNLPRFTRYFIQPAAGINWGILHPHNAVDIANSCGTPVVAAASGVVIAADGSGSWNSGYGNLVDIEHPNGTGTKYSHLSGVSVAIGDSVDQGQQIGTIGNSGRVTGATGCHLHFEVRGASNPFAKR